MTCMFVIFLSASLMNESYIPPASKHIYLSNMTGYQKAIGSTMLAAHSNSINIKKAARLTPGCLLHLKIVDLNNIGVNQATTHRSIQPVQFGASPEPT